MTVIGYVSPNNVPVELIEAHGATAREIVGDHSTVPTVGDEYMESFFDGHVRSIFDQVLKGKHSDLDLLVIPRSSEDYLQLYYYLEEARRWTPEAPIPRIHLFDLLQTPAYATSQYVHSRVKLLEDTLTEVTGKSASTASLEAAIAARNEWRAAVGAASKFRRVNPEALPGSTFLKTLRASGQKNTAAATAALAQLIASPPASESTSGRTRLLIKGSPHDDVRIYEELEAMGFDIVADDHLTGERIAENQLQPHTAGWLWAIAEHYQRNEVSIRSYPQVAQDERFLALVDESDTDAVLFVWEQGDDTFGWDYPSQRVQLDMRAVPHAVARGFSYFQPDLERLRSIAAPLLTTAFEPA